MLARERRMSVRQVQECTDADEFAEWLAYQELDPATEERADLRSAIIAAVIANLFRGKSGKAASPMDFMPFAERPQRSSIDIENDILAWAKGRQRMQEKAKALRG